MKNPFSDFPVGFVYYISMPLFGLIDGYSSLNNPFTNFYLVNGVQSDIFWAFVNILYWIFWINFMVATFNVLPMLPLDGGYMTKDLIDSFLKRFKSNMSKEIREKIANKTMIVISLVILFVILAPIIIPNLRSLS